MKTVSVTSLEQLVETGVVHLTRGKVISKRDIAAYPGEHPIYSSAKDNDGKFGEYGKYLYDEELITWSVDGGGRLFHRPRHKFSVTNVGGVLRIQDKSVLDYRYLYYVLTLRHSEIVFDWVKKAHPSVIKKLYTSIPVPGLNEQKQIVQKLDEAFAGIAKAKENAEKNLQNARALFESHLETVFTQRGPGWVEKRLEECFRLKSGDALTSSAMKDGNYPVFGGNGIAGMHDKFNLSGDNVIIGRVGALCGNARHITEKIWLTDNAFRITDSCFEFDGAFLAYLLNFKNLRSFARQTAQPVISNSSLKDLSLQFPDIGKQKRISEHLDLCCQATQRLTRLYKQKQAALEALKKSILHEAFSGNL